jgi:hypothetical protein
MTDRSVDFTNPQAPRWNQEPTGDGAVPGASGSCKTIVSVPEQKRYKFIEGNHGQHLAHTEIFKNQRFLAHLKLCVTAIATNGPPPPQP